MAIVFILAAILAASVGIFLLSEATMGVGILALACFFGILARIAQADAHHKKLTITLENLRNQTPNQ